MHLLMFMACVFGVAFGANIKGLTLDQISQLIAGNMDTDKNGELTFIEIYTDIASKYDDNNDKCISEHEFVKHWSHEYHDDHQASVQFFLHLDLSKDGCLNEAELRVHYNAMDQNVDGIVTYEELRVYMHNVHPDRVGHGHNGHHG